MAGCWTGAPARSRTLLETRLFLGWFDPRGLASILLALLAAHQETQDRVLPEQEDAPEMATRRRLRP